MSVSYKVIDGPGAVGRRLRLCDGNLRRRLST